MLNICTLKIIFATQQYSCIIHIVTRSKLNIEVYCTLGSISAINYKYHEYKYLSKLFLNSSTHVNLSTPWILAAKVIPTTAQ